MAVSRTDDVRVRVTADGAMVVIAPLDSCAAQSWLQQSGTVAAC